MCLLLLIQPIMKWYAYYTPKYRPTLGGLRELWKELKKDVFGVTLELNGEKVSENRLKELIESRGYMSSDWSAIFTYIPSLEQGMHGSIDFRALDTEPRKIHFRSSQSNTTVTSNWAFGLRKDDIEKFKTIAKYGISCPPRWQKVVFYLAPSFYVKKYFQS